MRVRHHNTKTGSQLMSPPAPKWPELETWPELGARACTVLGYLSKDFQRFMSAHQVRYRLQAKSILSPAVGGSTEPDTSRAIHSVQARPLGGLMLVTGRS